MDTSEYLTEMSNMLDNIGGEPFDIGCQTENLDDIFEKWKNNDSGKRVRAVKDWCWWDLVDSYQIKVPSDIAIPSLIYSQYIINSSDSMFVEGNWVRTTFLVKLHDNCVFETRNTFYILVGHGSRKSVDIGMAFSIF